MKYLPENRSPSKMSCDSKRAKKIPSRVKKKKGERTMDAF